jgi:ABC-2 type transport system ATP-binding protein
MTVAVSTRGLSKAYSGKTVVDDLNLSVAEGEVFGLLGPNGAGKTTTILMLLGLTEPTAGTAEVYGHSPTREALQVKRLIGYLPENVGFYGNLTARENLQFIAELNGIGEVEADARIDQLLVTVGLADATSKTVSQYSKGMRQRLGIADVLIKQPKVAILDEPTGGLDPEGINQMLALIAGLPGRGTTVILSSHQLYQVQKICHRVGIMSQGRMVVQGALDELARQAGGGTRYRIEVETTASGDEAARVVGEVKGVNQVEVKENRLLIGADEDLRAEISRVMAANNLPLIQMDIQQFTLDDIYMKYFKEADHS